MNIIIPWVNLIAYKYVIKAGEYLRIINNPRILDLWLWSWFLGSRFRLFDWLWLSRFDTRLKLLFLLLEFTITLLDLFKPLFSLTLLLFLSQALCFFLSK